MNVSRVKYFAKKKLHILESRIYTYFVHMRIIIFINNYVILYLLYIIQYYNTHIYLFLYYF